MKHLLLKATALSAAFLSFAPLAHADAETDALRAQVKLLESRLDQLEKKQKSTTTAKAAPVAAAPKAIEQRLAIVERKQEVAQEAADAQAAKAPTVDVGYKGLSVTSADKQYGVNLRAYGQLDNRTYLDSGRNGTTNTFLVRSLRPIMEAKMTDYFNGRIMLDFGKGATTVLDAYVDFHPIPGNQIVNFRAGEFKSPVGIERAESEQELEFVERGLTTNLVPYRDTGLMAYGSLIPDQLEYQIGVLNGATDGSSAITQVNTGDYDNHYDFAGRLLAYPLRWTSFEPARGLGVALAGTYGTHTGTAGTPQLTSGYTSIGQSKFFGYTTNTFASGTQWRFNPQVLYYKGPFGGFGEYVADSQEVQNGATHRVIRNDGWIATASWVLTGEDASFDGVKPENPLTVGKPGWGAWELVARAGGLKIDADAFPLFASATASAREASEFGGGINWYANNSLKVNFDYMLTRYDGGAAAGHDRPDERVFLTRTQFRF